MMSKNNNNQSSPPINIPLTNNLDMPSLLSGSSPIPQPVEFIEMSPTVKAPHHLVMKESVPRRQQDGLEFEGPNVRHEE